jgi:prephenate dehydratase
MRIGYLGPEGTFSHEALLAGPGGPDAEAVPLGTVHDTVMAVQSGDVDRAVVPIENSLEGAVNPALDALALDAPDVEIVAEAIRPIRLCLIAARELPLDEIEAVVSHPHASAQCARFLRASLPHARVASATSTAEAVRMVAADPERPWAALGPRVAAELYACRVLRDGVEDVAGNETRFVWLAPCGTGSDSPGPRKPRSDSPGPHGAGSDSPARKTSVIFSGAGAAAPGWLVRCLSEFAQRGVNLSKIESRPRKERLGSYLFWIDLEGDASDEAVAAAIAGLKGHCDEVRVLGSYAAA